MNLLHGRIVHFLPSLLFNNCIELSLFIVKVIFLFVYNDVVCIYRQYWLTRKSNRMKGRMQLVYCMYNCITKVAFERTHPFVVRFHPIYNLNTNGQPNKGENELKGKLISAAAGFCDRLQGRDHLQRLKVPSFHVLNSLTLCVCVCVSYIVLLVLRVD